MERLFGVIKRRFPVLAYGCRLKLDTIMTIIVATCILHNIAVRADERVPPIPEDIDEDALNGLILLGNIPAMPNHMINPNQNVAGIQLRNNLVRNYFANM